MALTSLVSLSGDSHGRLNRPVQGIDERHAPPAQGPHVVMAPSDDAGNALIPITDHEGAGFVVPALPAARQVMGPDKAGATAGATEERVQLRVKSRANPDQE